MTERAPQLARTFVDVADTLVAEFDIVEFLTTLADRCVDLLDVSDAGIMLADPAGLLQVVASSSQRMKLLELFELQHDDGPCVDSYRTSRQVRADPLDAEAARWPRFGPEAVAAGFTGVYGVPMRLRERTIGSLNLLRTHPGALPDGDLAIAQALADVATVGILQHRAANENRLVAEQLQYALNSRVTIEQAKGMLSAYAGLDMDAAFALLRQYARNTNQKLIDVSQAIADRVLSPDTVCARRDEIGRTALPRATTEPSAPESAPADAVIVMDPQGTIIYWDSNAERLYGWSSNEVLGRKILDVTPTPESREQGRAALDTVRAGNSYSGVFPRRHKDGSLLLVDMTATPIGTASGEMVGFIALCRRADASLATND